MKTATLILALAALAGCASGPQKTAEVSSAATTNPVAATGSSPAATMPPVATVNPTPVQPVVASLPTQVSQTTNSKPENGWEELSRFVASWSGSMHKAMSDNCPQESTAKQ